MKEKTAFETRFAAMVYSRERDKPEQGVLRLSYVGTLSGMNLFLEVVGFEPPLSFSTLFCLPNVFND